MGKDNEAAGFNDQSDSLPALSPSALTTNPSTNPGTNIFSTTNPSTNPGTNIFSTTNNNNITINVDNSICDQSGTTSANSPQTISFNFAQNPVNGNSTATLSIADSFNAIDSSSSSQSCSFTLNNSTFNQGVGISEISSPIITLNPTGGPCAAPLVNAVITTTNPPRTLDVCVAL